MCFGCSMTYLFPHSHTGSKCLMHACMRFALALTLTHALTMLSSPILQQPNLPCSPGALAKTPWNLDGLFINCGSQSGAPWGASTNYCLSTGNQNYLVQMQYCPTGAFGCGSQKQNWTGAGWAITGFNASSKLDTEHAVFAKCTTDECQKATTPEHLSGTGWMVSTDQGGTFEPVPLAVNTSCCDSTAASCGERPGHQACNVKDCEAKYTSFWSCLAASAVGCCQAFVRLCV